jgi:hypothetical protein
LICFSKLIGSPVTDKGTPLSRIHTQATLRRSSPFFSVPVGEALEASVEPLDVRAAAGDKLAAKTH